MRILRWETTTNYGEHPDNRLPDGFVAAGPWEPIGCGISNGRQNGGVEDMETVFCWRRPLGDGSQEDDTLIPTDVQIERRVKLLKIVAEHTERPSGYYASGYIFASFDGCYYLALRGSPSVQSRTWTEVEKNAFDAEVYRVAVFQLMSEFKK